MKAFKFPLEKVLGWRHLQMRTEEDRLAGIQRQLETLTRRADALAAAEEKAKTDLLNRPTVHGSDLQAFTAFQERVRKERALLAAEIAQCQKRIAAQRARLLKARKDFRVLEKLRERRVDAWNYSFNHELEELAADAHISRLIRGDS